MLSENRIFHYSGSLKINRSRILASESLPKDDIVNWLFLKDKESQWSFVYRIENPIEANYNHPFNIDMAFTAIDAVAGIIQLKNTYEVLRGQEMIGTILIEKKL